MDTNKKKPKLDCGFQPKGDGFGKDLARLIEFRRMTGHSLSKAICVHPSTVYGWINGRTLPTLGMLCRLADGLGVSVSDLFGLIAPADWAAVDRPVP